jgi:AraC-like DNA-binding protein
MNTFLNNRPNWPQLALQANWSVTKLAKLCGISSRTLERHFYAYMKKSPKSWLAEQRQRHGWALLCSGLSVKETAASLGYRHPTHFSRDFKKHLGSSPTAKSDGADRQIQAVAKWSDSPHSGLTAILRKHL